MDYYKLTQSNALMMEDYASVAYQLETSGMIGPVQEKIALNLSMKRLVRIIAKKCYYRIKRLFTRS